jgi:hypothetical protein
MPADDTQSLADILAAGMRERMFSGNQQKGEALMPTNWSWQSPESSVTMPASSRLQPPHFTTGWDAVNQVTVMPLIADVNEVDTEPIRCTG